MTAAPRFDTPFKRMSLLALIAGAVTLAISLVSWTLQNGFNKIYYSKNHYLWLPVDPGYSGQVERKWSWDQDCVRPVARARIDSLKAELDDHRRARPEKPTDALVDYRLLFEPERRSKEIAQSIAESQRQRAVSKAYLQWSSKERSLKIALDSATARLSRLNYSGVREGELFQANPRLDLWEPLISKETDTRTEEVRFRDRLYSRLGLTAFATGEQDRIFGECVQETMVGYKLIDKSYHTEIADWPADHPIAFLLGLAMTVGGVLGSYGHAASTFLIQRTFGRLLFWLKTGEMRPLKVSSSPTLEVPDQAPSSEHDAQESQASKEKSA